MSKPSTMVRCPACGSNVIDHCKTESCTWWRCPNRNCSSFGYDDHRYVDNRERKT